MKTRFFFFFILLFPISSFSQELTTVKLPAPDTSGGKPLMQALKERKTQRSFAKQKLSQNQLSNLLWAAFGINRPIEGKRTAPSAVDWQETDLYVVLEEGIYLYDAKKNQLSTIIAGDYRSKMGVQGFAGNAPVIIVMVADYSKMGSITPKEDKDFYSAVDAGYISQNIYLYCASENLATVVLGLINRSSISKTLKLKDKQNVILTQCVGFPEK